MSDPFDVQIPLLDELDSEIVMHRNVHFGGSFDVMIDYYKNEGVGVMEEFTIGRIEKLKAMGPEVDQMLSEEAKSNIRAAQKTYQDLRLVYEKELDPKLLRVTDLILSEDEVPQKEMDAVVAAPEITYGALINLIDSIDYYDPLFPGYGRAPELAATCLGRIGNPEAIPALFNAMAVDDFFASEAIISALTSFGDKAKEYLLKVLGTKPYGKDNDMAAVALSAMPDDEEVSKTALRHLLNPNFQKHESFVIYLVLLCSGLKMDEDREIFRNLKKKDFHRQIHDEIDLIIASWN